MNDKIARMTAPTLIAWSRPMLARFKLLHSMAVHERRQSFTFDGYDYDVDYAKYLIEYLTEQFK